MESAELASQISTLASEEASTGVKLTNFQMEEANLEVDSEKKVTVASTIASLRGKLADVKSEKASISAEYSATKSAEETAELEAIQAEEEIALKEEEEEAQLKLAERKEDDRKALSEDEELPQELSYLDLSSLTSSGKDDFIPAETAVIAKVSYENEDEDLGVESVSTSTEDKA